MLAFVALITLLVASDVMAGKGPQPSICTRSCWGARGARSITYMSGLSRAIVHHTAGAGDYNTTSLTTSKSKIRAIQNYHMDNLGWSDIAYHFLTDKLGNMFEGRYNSMSNLPRGSHDSCNYNSFGFTVIGYYHYPYNQAFTSASENALEALIAWRMPSTWGPSGSGSYCGRTVYTMDSHRKVTGSACPGDIVINRLSAMRSGVTSRKNGGSSPSAPSGLKATSVSASRIDLTWTDNSGIESGFKVERKTGSGGTYSQIGTTAANDKTYSSTGLSSGTTYYYRVRAYNSYGNSAYSGSAGATTKDTIPGAPTGLTATAVSNDQINLAWTQNSANEDGFRIFRSTDGTNYSAIVTVGVNVVSYSNTGLTGNRKYWYRVTSYNTAGNSAYSNIASDTTAPHAPTALTATAAGSTPTTWDKINLSWTDNAGSEVGFKIERATASAGPFTQIATNAASDTTYTATGLSATTTYWFRVRSYNANGNSDYSNTASAATGNAPPVLTAIGNKTVAAGAALAFTATASDPNATSTTTTWQAFTSFGHNTANETVLFKRPSNSASTSSFLDTSTNFTRVVSNGPSVWGSGNKSMATGWGFKTGTANYWVRLNTFNTLTNPNPAIALDQSLRFKIYSDKAVKVGLGVRETGTTAAYGANGGTTGSLEWAGVTNVVSGQPIPSRLIAAATSTTVTFNIPFESQAAFTGDGKIDQSGAKGVMEHLVVKGEGGTGNYRVWFDDFAVIVNNNNVYSLDAGAPAGATIGRRTGKFSWTPTTGQVGTHNITVRVTDRLGGQDFETIVVTVTGTGNNPPVLAAIGAKTVKEQTALTFTATATDADAGQTLTFSLDAGAPAGASISTAGAFSWTPTEAQGPGSYPVTVRVTDNGSPAGSDTETITVSVQEANTAPVLAAITDKSVTEGTALSGVTASATDADVPANSITYSLLNAPAGMTINASSGAISWTPTEAQGPDVYQVTVRATDNGSPALNSSTSFNVTANEANTAPVLTIPTTSTKVYDFANFDLTDDEPNGVIMFRHPLYSSTSSSFLDATPNTSLLSTSAEYPDPDGNGSEKVLKTSFSFKTGTVNPWLRLTTFTMNTNPAYIPNPTIDLSQKLRVKVYTDKSIKLAIGVRETGFNAPIGYNGYYTGPIEYVGVSGKQANGCPIPTRTIAAGAWTTVEFNFPTESCANFVSGDGILTTGKGVLEQIAIVPNGGTGAYNVYFDEFQVVKSSTQMAVDTYATISFNCTATDADNVETVLTYSLAANAPTNAFISPITGEFSWTPTPEQSSTTNTFGIVVTDDGNPNLSDTENVTIIVNKVNTTPELANVPDDLVIVGNSEVFTVDLEGNDEDLPGDTLTFSIVSGPSGASINASTGVITWNTPASGSSTNTFTVRVTDNGSPVLFSEESFKVAVTPGNVAPVLTLGAARVTEPVISFETFTNGTPSEQVMFKKPANSTTTSAYIDTAVTNFTTITTSFPAGNANAGAKVLRADWSFKTGVTDYWVRLTTFNTTLLPNPVFNTAARLKFDIYTTKALKVGLGIRETASAVENGGNGGTTGAIEYVGCGGKIGTTPIPTRSVNSGAWTTLEFDLPNELVQTLTGDGVLAAGQNVLEHLILKGEGGSGAYSVYVDNFQVVEVVPSLDSTVDGEVIVTMKANSTLSFDASATDTDAVTFGFDVGQPGATIVSSTGVFSWTPGSGDAGGQFDFGIYVEDSPANGALKKRDSDGFIVNVVADTIGTQSTDAAPVIYGTDAGGQ